MSNHAPYGPFATPTGRMTPEGQAFLTTWLLDWPEPGRLLAKVYRALYAAALNSGLDYEELNALCGEAACVSLLSYDPARAKFQTYVVRKMRCVVGQRLRVVNKARDRGCTVTSEPSGDDFKHPNSLWDRATGVENADVGRIDTADEAAAILDLFEGRDREVIAARFGLGDGPPKTLEKVGASYGVSRERMRQVQHRAIRNLREELGVEV